MAAAAGRRIGGAPPGNTDEDETGDNQSDHDEPNEVADLPADQQEEAVRPPAGVGLPPAVLDPARRVLLLARAPPAIAPAMARVVPPPPGGYAAQQPPTGLPPVVVPPALAGPALIPVIPHQVMAPVVPIIVPPAAPLAAGRAAVVMQQPAAAAPQIPGVTDPNFLIVADLMQQQLTIFQTIFHEQGLAIAAIKKETEPCLLLLPLIQHQMEDLIQGTRQEWRLRKELLHAWRISQDCSDKDVPPRQLEADGCLRATKVAPVMATSPRQDRSAAKCYRCRGVGHYARECPSDARTVPAVAPKPTEN